MKRFRTQEALDAYTRSTLNEAQKVTFDQLMATGTWKVNKSLGDGRQYICWLQAKTGNAVIGLDLAGKIQRPVKGSNTVKFNSRTLERVY